MNGVFWISLLFAEECRDSDRLDSNGEQRGLIVIYLQIEVEKGIFRIWKLKLGTSRSLVVEFETVHEFCCIWFFQCNARLFDWFFYSVRALLIAKLWWRGLVSVLLSQSPWWHQSRLCSKFQIYFTTRTFLLLTPGSLSGWAATFSAFISSAYQTHEDLFSSGNGRKQLQKCSCLPAMLTDWLCIILHVRESSQGRGFISVWRGRTQRLPTTANNCADELQGCPCTILFRVYLVLFRTEKTGECVPDLFVTRALPDRRVMERKSAMAFTSL